jgi:YD repeat-containing protein
MQYQYDASGDLVAVIDRQSDTTQLIYQAPHEHYLTQVIDSLGHTGIRTDYDSHGRLISETAAAGNSVGLSYDPTDSTEVVDQLGNPTTYAYDDRGNILKETDALGGVTTRSYDAANDLLTETDPLGRTTTYTYDALGNILTETDPLGRVTRHTYQTFLLYTNLRMPLAPITLKATSSGPALRGSSASFRRQTTERCGATNETGEGKNRGRPCPCKPNSGSIQGPCDFDATGGRTTH